MTGINSSGVVPPRAKASIFTFFAFFFLIATCGSFYIYQQSTSFRETKEVELSAIADLKAVQISNWYGERMGGARAILQTAVIQRQAAHILEHQSDLGSRQQLLAWMDTVRKAYGYQFIALYSADGVVRCVAPAGAMPPSMAKDADFQGVVRTAKLQAGDLHRAQGNGVLDILAPVGSQTKGGAAVVGVWLMRADPYRSLYPLVQSWPTPTRTAETLLVRQDGSDVLVLNELRHRPNAAVILRRSMNQYPTLAATQAIKGREGIVERPDYRDVPTLAAIRRVAGTPWFLVAKIDTDELYAPLRQRTWNIMLLLAVLTAIAALGTAAIAWPIDFQMLFHSTRHKS